MFYGNSAELEERSYAECLLLGCAVQGIWNNFRLLGGDRLMKDRCEKECFANLNNRCLALSESIEDCPFQRTDIRMEEQNRDIARYNSKKKYEE